MSAQLNHSPYSWIPLIQREQQPEHKEIVDTPTFENWLHFFKKEVQQLQQNVLKQQDACVAIEQHEQITQAQQKSNKQYTLTAIDTFLNIIQEFEKLYIKHTQSRANSSKSFFNFKLLHNHQITSLFNKLLSKLGKNQTLLIRDANTFSLAAIVNRYLAYMRAPSQNFNLDNEALSDALKTLSSIFTVFNNKTLSHTTAFYNTHCRYGDGRIYEVLYQSYETIKQQFSDIIHQEVFQQEQYQKNPATGRNAGKLYYDITWLIDNIDAEQGLKTAQIFKEQALTAQTYATLDALKSTISKAAQYLVDNCHYPENIDLYDANSQNIQARAGIHGVFRNAIIDSLFNLNQFIKLLKKADKNCSLTPWPPEALGYDTYSVYAAEQSKKMQSAVEQSFLAENMEPIGQSFDHAYDNANVAQEGTFSYQFNGKREWAILESVQTFDEETRIWQIRMSVLPSKDNINKLRKALLRIEELHNNNRHPTLKVFVPFDENQKPYYWDGTQAPPEGHVASDRSQPGKELCIYMDYNSDTKQYVFDTAYFKDLILKIWRACEDLNVKISYITPPIDELEIPCTNDIIRTPFCYSSYKHYKHQTELGNEEKGGTHHGILLAADANPKNFPDPLQGITITEADLKDYGIKGYATHLVAAKRIVFMQHHIEDSEQRLIDELTSMDMTASHASFINPTSNKPTYDIQIENINTILKNKNNDTFLEKCKALTEEDFSCLPRVSDANLSPVLSTVLIKTFIKRDNIPFLRDQLSNRCTLAAQEMQLLKDDYQEDTLKLFLKKQFPGFNFKLINHNPAQMQRFYRRFKLIEKEKEALSREQTLLQQINIYPETLTQVWNNDENPDSINKTKALLKQHHVDITGLQLYDEPMLGINDPNHELHKTIGILANTTDFERLINVFELKLGPNCAGDSPLATLFSFVVQQSSEYQALEPVAKPKIRAPAV